MCLSSFEAHGEIRALLQLSACQEPAKMCRFDFRSDRPRTSTSVCSLKLLVYAALSYFRSDRLRTSTSTRAAERAAFRAHNRQQE